MLVLSSSDDSPNSCVGGGGSQRSIIGGGSMGQSVTAAGLGWLPGMSAPSAPAEEPSCSASAAGQR